MVSTTYWIPAFAGMTKSVFPKSLPGGIGNVIAIRPAQNGRAKQFYEHYGFQESPQHPMTLMLRLNPAKA